MQQTWLHHMLILLLIGALLYAHMLYMVCSSSLYAVHGFGRMLGWLCVATPAVTLLVCAEDHHFDGGAVAAGLLVLLWLAMTWCIVRLALLRKISLAVDKTMAFVAEAALPAGMTRADLRNRYRQEIWNRLR